MKSPGRFFSVKIVAVSSVVLVGVIVLLLSFFFCLDETAVAAGTPLPTGTVGIGGTIPATAACRGGTVCNSPGSICFGLLGRCRDTFDVQTFQCECRCLL
jgi:hypothetical protein